MHQRLALKYHTRSWPSPPGPQERFWLFHAALPHQRGVLTFFMEWDTNLPRSLFAPLYAAVETQSQLCLQSIDQDQHAQYRFEQLLESLNKSIDDFYTERPHAEHHLHFAVGLFLVEQFFFSGHGNTCALFLRRTGSESFRVFDLALNVMSEAGHSGHRRPLRTVLDGTWQCQDACLIGSASLPSTVPLETLHPWLTQLPPVTVQESMSQTFHLDHMAFFLAQMAPEKAGPLVGVEGELGSRESLEKFHEMVMDTRKESSQTLSVSETNEAQQWWQNARTLLQGVWQKSTIRLRPTLRLTKKWISTLRIRLPEYLWHMRKRAGSAARLRQVERLRLLTHRSIPWRSIALGACACLFLVSGWYLARNLRQNRSFATAMATAETESQTAKNAILYNDSSRVNAALAAAQQALASVAPRNADQRAIADRLQASVQDTRARLERRRTPTIASTTFLAAPLAASDSSLLLADGSVWDTSAQTPSPKTASNGSTIIKAVSTAQGFFTFESTGSSSARFAPDFLPKNTSSWSNDVFDAFPYADRLYAVSASGIYRRPYNADGSLAGSSAWLDSPETFATSTAIAVDTTIWLTQGNRLRTFQAGKEQVNTISIQPAFVSIQDVFTAKDLPYLFLLDQGAGGRVIVLDKKTRTVLAQYTDTRFTTATHLWVSTDGRTVSVASKNTLLSFPLDL